MKSKLSIVLPDLFESSLVERRRGSRAKVKLQLQAYTPFILPLCTLVQTPKLLDLGSGRGEWLEIVRDAGFEGVGADSDPVNVATCQMHGLEVCLAHPLELLSTVPSQSIAMVSAFGLVDCLSLDHVRALIQGALRVLIPGGILILGANNPEYAALGVTAQYGERSNTQAIRPDLLDYVVGYEGFDRHIIARIFDRPLTSALSKLNLLEALSSELPSFSVIAQKSAPQETLGAFDNLFNERYGLSLQELAMRYLNEQDQELTRIHEQANLLSSRIVSEAERINAALAAQDLRIVSEAERINAALAGIYGQLDSIRYFIKVVAKIEAGLRWLLRPIFRRELFWPPLKTRVRFYLVVFMKRVGMYSSARKLYFSIKPKSHPPVSTMSSQDQMLTARAFEISGRLKKALKKTQADN